jgi:hypothetical protein
MHCIFRYQNLVIGINLKTQARKGLISYYKTNGITFFKKHVDVNHYLIAQEFEEKTNNLLKEYCSIGKNTSIKEKNKYIWRVNL